MATVFPYAGWEQMPKPESGRRHTRPRKGWSLAEIVGHSTCAKLSVDPDMVDQIAMVIFRGSCSALFRNILLEGMDASDPPGVDIA